MPAPAIELCSSIPHSTLRIPHWAGAGGGGVVRVGVDLGGTFTDLVALAGNGTIEVRKVVTTPDGPDGVLEPLGEDEVGRVVAAVRALAPAPEALAVALLFAFRHAEHERRLVAALRDALPDVPVVGSHEVLPVFREFERTSTTTVEAYLRPKVSAYLGRLEREVRARGIGLLRVMTSSGGTLPPGAAAARAASLALSGPAGGVVGARLVGAAVGLRDLLTLDMGGTSADASLVTGGTPLGGGGSVAGLAVALPAVLIETVSAGGGSIARVDDGGALQGGPESAGAVPGPACYSRGGGRPTGTDACLALRWLGAPHPPPGPGGA